MKVFRNRRTGKLGETQFKEDAGVLIRNARQYYPDGEIEIIDMTPEQYGREILLQNESEKSPEGKKEAKIEKEERAILRKQAVDSLKAKGEI